MYVLSSANYVVLFIWQHWLFNHLAVRMRRNNLAVLVDIVKNFKITAQNLQCTNQMYESTIDPGLFLLVILEVQPEDNPIEHLKGALLNTEIL